MLDAVPHILNAGSKFRVIQIEQVSKLEYVNVSSYEKCKQDM